MKIDTRSDGERRLVDALKVLEAAGADPRLVRWLRGALTRVKAGEDARTALAIPNRRKTDWRPVVNAALVEARRRAGQSYLNAVLDVWEWTGTPDGTIRRHYADHKAEAGAWLDIFSTLANLPKEPTDIGEV